MSRRYVVGLGGLVAVAIFGYTLGTAYAHGVPGEPLVYSGTLLQDGAHPSSGTNVTVGLYDMVTGGTRLCAGSDPTGVDPITGRFSATLGADCRSALEAHTDVFVQVSVVGATAGQPGRTQVQAVPYALEADHATRASLSGEYCGASATHDGMLGGWPNVRVACAAIATCDRATAHICSSDEISQNLQRGVSIEVAGWVAGAYVHEQSPGLSVSSCVGWTSNVASQYGHVFEAAGYPAYYACNTSLPTLCCN